MPEGWKTPINVAVSGAAGQISNHLLFMVRICWELELLSMFSSPEYKTYIQICWMILFLTLCP